MRPLFDVIQKLFSRTKQCCVIGKGETYSKVQTTNLSEYQTIGLNHVAEMIPVDFAHCIDLDVLSTPFVQNCKYAILPYHPHINFKVSPRTLSELIHENDFLQELDNSGKLLWYNCSTWKGFPQNPSFPVIDAKFFSSEAVFNIVARLGIKEIYSLGIDGGNNYAEVFKHLTPLQNGRNSFDDQFPRLKKVCKEFQLDWIQL